MRDWPFSYFSGMLIGLAMASGLAILDSQLRNYLQPTGLCLSLGGWGLIFGSTVERMIRRSPSNRLQEWIHRGSIVVGIILNAIAWTFLVTPL